MNFTAEGVSAPKPFKVMDEDDAEAYLKFPQDMCFNCPIFHGREFEAFKSWLSYIHLLQDAGMDFDLNKFDPTTVVCLGYYKRWKKTSQYDDIDSNG